MAPGSPSEPLPGAGAPGPPNRLCPGTHPQDPPRRRARAQHICTARAPSARNSSVPRTTHRTVDTGTDSAAAIRAVPLGTPAGTRPGGVRRGPWPAQHSGCCRHGHSYLGTGWASRSCHQCPRHRRHGRPRQGRSPAGARVPRDIARASGSPSRSPPRPARRGPCPRGAQAPAAPRPRSPAGGRRRWPWRGWCRWHKRRPRCRCAAPPGARHSGCCRPPAAGTADLQGGTGVTALTGDGPPAPVWGCTALT